VPHKVLGVTGFTVDNRFARLPGQLGGGDRHDHELLPQTEMDIGLERNDAQVQRVQFGHLLKMFQLLQQNFPAADLTAQHRFVDQEQKVGRIRGEENLLPQGSRLHQAIELASRMPNGEQSPCVAGRLQQTGKRKRANRTDFRRRLFVREQHVVLRGEEPSVLTEPVPFPCRPGDEQQPLHRAGVRHLIGAEESPGIGHRDADNLGLDALEFGD
jgi:hypothetical protein